MAKKTTAVEVPSIDSHIMWRVSVGSHHDPHSILGAHLVSGGVVIRTLKPLAVSVTANLEGGVALELSHLENGIWQGTISGTKIPDYRISATYEDGNVWETDDPYHYAPTLGDLDLHLIAEGRHEELWQALGSHVIEMKTKLGKSAGTKFAVWAPNAQAVRVVGDFNHWNGTGHSMRVMGSSGVWELFIP
ncbi:MAG: hypothetical protein RL530_448, partial [Actinomycetota bacterium]